MSAAPLYQRRADVLINYGVTNRLLSLWQARRLIPFVKVGRKTTLFKTADLEEFLKRHTVRNKRLAAGAEVK